MATKKKGQLTTLPNGLSTFAKITSESSGNPKDKLRNLKFEKNLTQMSKSNSYVYFAFQGDNFDPNVVTTELALEPTESWRVGEPGKYIQQQKYSCWQLKSTSDELLDMDKLVNEVLYQLSDRIESINKLKEKHSLNTVLGIVMYVDTNEEQSTPYLGHNSEVINFLHLTGTKTDLDIYRYHSSEE